MADSFKNWEEKFTVYGESVSVYSHQLDEINEFCDNIDVFIDYKGQTYAGDLMTPRWVSEYIETNDMGDVSWYCGHGLILQNLSKPKIVAAISSLVKQGIEIDCDILGQVFVLSETS